MAKKKKKTKRKLDPIEEFKRVCRKHLTLTPETEVYIDVIFGAVFANRLDADPTWIYIIGPPSCGKTVIIEAMAGHKRIHAMDTLSRKSLINSIDNKDSKSALLPMLDGKIFLITDFTTMLTMRYDELHEVLGYLRQIYDGKLCKHITGKGMVRYESTFGIIAAVTGAIDRHKKALVDLGERFLSYRMPRVDARAKRKRGLQSLRTPSKAVLKAEIKRAAHKLLDCEPKVPGVDDRILKEIIAVTEFATKVRSEIKRDKYSKDPEEPEEEFYERMSNQLLNLCKGIAMAHGRQEVLWGDLKIARHTAVHCGTRRRIRLIRLMLGKRKWVDLDLIHDKMSLSHAGAKIQLEDLRLVGLADRRSRLSEKGGDKFEWMLWDRKMLKRVLS